MNPEKGSDTEVFLTRSARRDILALDEKTYQRIARRIASLTNDPFPPGVRKIRGQENSWRLRVGDFRILYEPQPKEKRIVIYRVKHRKDVYG